MCILLICVYSAAVKMMRKRVQTNRDEVVLPELNDYEWKRLHDVLLYPCESGPHQRSGAWRAAKHRIKRKLKEILDKKFIDWETCQKLKHEFEDDDEMLAHFGILHLVQRGGRILPPEGISLPSSSSSTAPSEQSVPSSSGNVSSGSQPLQDDAAAAGGVPSSVDPPFEMPMLDVDEEPVQPNSSPADEEPHPTEEQSASGTLHVFLNTVYYIVPAIIHS